MFGEAIKRQIDVGGFQNIERIISDVLKEETYRSLNFVKKIDDETLQLDFSELNFHFKQKRMVVQFSKKKYKKEEVEAKIKEEKNKKSALYEPLWTDIQVVELPRVWLAFEVTHESWTVFYATCSKAILY